jgi:hypothetical protein
MHAAGSTDDRSFVEVGQGGPAEEIAALVARLQELSVSPSAAPMLRAALSEPQAVRRQG